MKFNIPRLRAVFRLALASAVFSTVFLLLTLFVTNVQADDNTDLVARGKYLTHVAGCIGCHTPTKPEYSDLTKLTPEQLRTIALSGNDTLDFDKAYSGGRYFDLGPSGFVQSRNLTSDKETGLGKWSDAEIEAAIRFGVRSDGSQLYPLMPYRNFVGMAKEDMKAIIAFLRSLPAIKNEVPRRKSNGEQFPPVTAPSGGIPDTEPDHKNKTAWGNYLINTILSCTDCHTPLDAKTGAPLMDQKFAGGQPFEGPWGIVYSANLTPDKTGMGDWTEEQISAAIRTGVDKNGRRLIVMPWQDYSALTDEDVSAASSYLKNGLKPIENTVPPASINDLFNATQEAPTPEATK